MNLGQRSKLSLCQFLMLFDRDDLVLLFGKYGLPTDELENQWGGQNISAAVRGAVLQASSSQLGELVQELARTHGSMRTGVSPRCRFDERWNDLRLCLELDGYAKERNEYDIELDRFVPIEPVIEGADAPEDDLTKELRRSGLPGIDEILRLLEVSASAFRSGDLTSLSREMFWMKSGPFIGSSFPRRAGKRLSLASRTRHETPDRALPLVALALGSAAESQPESGEPVTAWRPRPGTEAQGHSEYESARISGHPE